jgi:hypothetical protein
MRGALEFESNSPSDDCRSYARAMKVSLLSEPHCTFESSEMGVTISNWKRVPAMNYERALSAAVQVESGGPSIKVRYDVNVRWIALESLLLTVLLTLPLAALAVARQAPALLCLGGALGLIHYGLYRVHLRSRIIEFLARVAQDQGYHAVH